MLAYIARRILLMIPTLFGIMLLSFVVVQFAPGGPVERIIAQLQGVDAGATARVSGAGGDLSGAAPRGSTLASSSRSSGSSASTSPPMSASPR
jgi:microcin C transport system permease protein